MQTDRTASHSLIGLFQRLCYVVHAAALTRTALGKLASCTAMTAAADTSIRASHNGSLGSASTRSLLASVPDLLGVGCRSVTMSRGDLAQWDGAVGPPPTATGADRCGLRRGGAEGIQVADAYERR
jgi:hypothetical protein